jgi:serine-type D-Ala-D-Ala carboxypeptidase
VIAVSALSCVKRPPTVPASPQPQVEVIMVPPAVPVASRWTPARLRLLTDSVHATLAEAAADSAFPGAYAIVGTSRGVIARDSVGRIDWAADAPMPNAHTLWDLASLTKVVGLTSAMAQLNGKRIDLDKPVQHYLPEFIGRDKERVTIRHLMTHTGGLPSWRPLYKEAVSPDSAVALAMITELDTAPGSRMVYSDLGLIILGKLVERVTGQPLDRMLTDSVFRPAGMLETMYNPPVALRPRIAPTEVDSWRGRHLRGEVHDENAFGLGGVAGHAGLFSSADDLARFARMYLNHGKVDGRRVLDSANVARFTTWQDSARHNRAIGWMKPSPPGWFGGSKMSSHAFGHTGFTGTSMYVDPDRDIFVILLTNRVNPTRMNTKIGRVRNRLADAVMSVALTSP